MGGHKNRIKRSQITDATLMAENAPSKQNVGIQNSILNKTETQQANMTPTLEDKLIEKPVTPISLSYAKKTML